MNNLLALTSAYAACDADDPIGCISPPISSGINPTTGQLTGIVTFGNTLLTLVFVVAGLFALVNFILAGFAFMSAGGDPKNVTKAWEKIWQTVLGLLIIVASFLIAVILGLLLFNNPMAILSPKL